MEGLAAVVMNSYRGAEGARGARGTAGSGSEARTLVDGFSLSLTHNHWLAVNRLDLHALFPLQVPENEVEEQEGRVSDAEEANGEGFIRGFEAPPLDAKKVNSILYEVTV